MNISKMFTWLEGEAARARRLVLISIIFVYLFVTLSTLAISSFGIDITEYFQYYMVFSGIVGTVVAFYTTTKAETDETEFTKIEAHKSSAPIE